MLCAGVIFSLGRRPGERRRAAVIAAILPPVLTGTVVMLIGLNLAGPVANNSTGRTTSGSP